MIPVYKYTVCFRSKKQLHLWGFEVFADKYMAQNFARQKKSKIRPKPYIIQTICDMSEFSEETYCEPIKNHKLNYKTYEKIIKY